MLIFSPGHHFVCVMRWLFLFDRDFATRMGGTKVLLSETICAAVNQKSPAFNNNRASF